MMRKRSGQEITSRFGGGTPTSGNVLHAGMRALRSFGEEGCAELEHLRTLPCHGAPVVSRKYSAILSILGFASALAL
jgi:hypothetical protein